MPKKGKQLEDFSGGVNTYADPQNIADNELAHCSGFKSELGEIVVLGDMKAAYSPSAANGNTIIEPGYGLFTFSHDYTAAGALGATDYLVVQGTSSHLILIYTSAGWVSAIDMGTSSSDEALNGTTRPLNPCFFFVDGALRVSPGNFTAFDTGANTNGAETVAPGYSELMGWIGGIQADSAKADAGDIIVINGVEYLVIVQDLGGGAIIHICVRHTTGFFPSLAVTGQDIHVMPDAKWRGIVNRRLFSKVTTAGTFIEWYTCPMTPKPPAYNFESIDDAVFVEVPFLADFHVGDLLSAGTGYTSGVVAIGTKNDNANTDGVWDTTVRFWISALYDDARQESQPFCDTTTETIASGAELGVVVNVQYSHDGTPAYCLNKRVVGARLYYEDTVNELGTLYQLLDIDFEKGCKKAESESYTPWVQRTADQEAICPTTTGATVADRQGGDAFTWAVPPKAATYEINTGYSAITNIHARFKTAVVANRRTYVGNVYEGGQAYGDRILYSPVNKFDILPETNALPLAIGDGDEIVKLATFADRLLSFKKRTLYIINIGGGALSAFIESEHANMGVENPCQVCDTEYGVAWVNKFGVFLYDGQKINELTRGKLQVSNSTRGLGLNIVESLSPLIGYHSLNKWIVVHVSSEISGDYEDEAWIFDFKNGSWTWSQEFTANAEYKTNMVNTNDNELIFAAGTNSTDTPNFFKLQGTGVSDPAEDNLFLLTKDFTLNVPSAKKNLHGVYITYSAGGTSQIEADIIYKHSTGEDVIDLIESGGGTTYYTAALGFKTTSGEKTTIQLVPSSGIIKNANSFQLKLHNRDVAHDSSNAFKLYNITFISRDRSPR